MNAIAPIDLESLAPIRQQQASCAALQAIIDTAIAAVTKLDFPLGWPTGGYDQPSALDLLSDLLPTQTTREMEDEEAMQMANARGDLVVDPGFNMRAFWNDMGCR